MKTINKRFLGLVGLIIAMSVSCKQDVINLKTVTPECTGNCPPYSKGDADFTKYVAIGNSLTSGYQAGALFNAGQSNSFPKILSGQFSVAQGTTLTFNQPDINSVNGYSSTVNGVELGRYILYAADGNINHAVPTPINPYLKVPTGFDVTTGPGFSDAAFYNVSFDKSKLNNFGVPGILLGQCLIGATGGPSSSNPYFNPYYARFASNPGTSTIIGDALAAAPTFFTFDLGNNDVLGYATTGGSGAVPLTKPSDFQTYYSNAIGALMTMSSAKGVVTTIPNVTTIPFFLTVPWNAIVFESGDPNIAATNSAYAQYNAGLDQVAGLGAISSSEAQKRKITFAAGANGIVIDDSKYLTDLTAYGLPSIRQATAADLITLTAGAVLGTEATPGNPATVWGVGKALTDEYVLVAPEIDSVTTHTTQFNQIINGVASTFNAGGTRIAVADVNAAFTSFFTNQAIVSDGVMITPSLKPPFGAFSEDGVHPNSRGYAYLANIIIDAINSKFAANVPHASLASYSGTGLPVTP